MKHRTAAKGFTLAEILIGLSLVGITAAVLLPAVMQSMGNNERDAKLKEAIQYINNTMQNGINTGDLTADQLREYFFSKVSTSKICPNDSETDSDHCWDAATQGHKEDSDQPGFVFNDGVVISGFDDFPADVNEGNNGNGLLIDWNGSRGPNIMGQDQLYVTICFQGNSTNYPGWCAYQPPNTMGPISCLPGATNITQADLDNNVVLYDQVMGVTPPTTFPDCTGGYVDPSTWNVVTNVCTGTNCHANQSH